MQKILIVDDNRSVCEALELLLSISDLESEAVTTPAEALQRVARGGVDLVIQDMNFRSDTTSGTEGIALFKALREIDGELPIVLLTAWTQLETAVELVKAGAADYLGKPWDDAKLLVTINNLLALRASRQQALRAVRSREQARAELAENFDLCGLIYRSELMHQLASLACRVAGADVPVLIVGASGTGKEKLAEILQRNSRVADKPFVRVNVGAIPVDLVASELFGAEAGAYTGSTRPRIGHFETADGGTLFLDEIATLPADGQVKLLRVLQSGEFQRLGSSQTRKVNVRVISATNAELKPALQSGEFREDLYYRLNVIELKLPNLAQRSEDIVPLAQSFLDQHHVLTKPAEKTLKQHSWPGNVRELENCIKRACLLASSGEIQAQDLLLGAPGISQTTEPSEAELRDLLRQHNGVISAVANTLGMSRQAVYRRLEKVGLHTAAAKEASQK